jgi:glyoxylase I family protein
MILLHNIHHVAIICTNINVSKNFYVNVLGFTVQQEVYRAARDSYKIDLTLQGNYCIELFSFPNPPKRVSAPEAAGLRHIAFAVHNIEQIVLALKDLHDIIAEPIRIDEYTGKKFTFIADPDNLPIELYEL